MNGFSFQSQNSSNRSYGIYVFRGSSNIAISNCSFNSLVYGVVSYSTASNGSYPSNTVSLSSCTFTGSSSWDVMNYDYSQLTVTSCTFQNPSQQVGGIYNSVQSDVTVSNSSFSASSYGVYLNDADDVSVSNTTFNTVAYALYGSSDTATITSCTTTGATYGCWINCDVSPITITGCTFSSGTYALMVPQYSATISNNTMNDNVVGLWIDGRVGSFTVSSSQNLSMARNQYGVYVEYRTDGARPAITVDSLSFGTGTSYGIFSYTGDITVRNCSFNGVGCGVYVHSNARTASVRNCSFNSSTTNWQVYSGTSTNTIRDCSFRDCTYGVYLYPTASSTPDIANVSFTNGTYAILAYNSNLNIGQSTNVTFSGAYLGWYGINCNSTFNNATISGASYPVYMYGGTLALTDTSVSNGVYNVYATSFTSCSLTRATIQGATGWGAYLSGQNVAITNATISRNTNGLYVQDTNATTRSQVSNLTCENNTNWGAAWLYSDFALGANQQSYLRNNGYGLGIFYDDVTLTETSGLTIANNTYGIYINTGNVTLSGVSLANNTYGLLHYYGSLNCSNSTITGGSYGLYNINGASASVSNSTFSGCTGYGVVISNSDATKVNQPVTVTNSTFSGGGTGIYCYALPDSRVTISGNTISNGTSHGTVLYNANVTFSNNNLTGNQNYGLYASDVALTLTDNTIATSGSYGAYLQGSSAPQRTTLTARRNRFDRNRYGLGMYQVAGSEVSNNVINNNQSGGYGVVSHSTSGTVEVWNNTIVDQYIGVYHYGGSARVKNNIIAYGDMNATRTSSYGLYRLNSAPLDASNNLLFGQTSKYYGTTRSAGDIIKPPRFVDRANRNFQLAMGSPAINAGTDASALLTTDIANNARPAFRGFEIGAYEYTGRSGSVRVMDWKETANRANR